MQEVKSSNLDMVVVMSVTISTFDITLFNTASFQGKSVSRRYLQLIMSQMETYQVSLGRSLSIPSAPDGRNEKPVQLKSDTQHRMVSDNRQRFLEIGFSSSDQAGSALCLRILPSNKTDLSENLVYTCNCSLTHVYAHYGGVSNTSV